MARRRLLRGYQHSKNIPWRWRQFVPLKQWHSPTKLKGVTAHKTMIPTVTVDSAPYYIQINPFPRYIWRKSWPSPCCLLVYKGFPSFLLASSFHFDILYAFRVSHIHATWSPTYQTFRTKKLVTPVAVLAFQESRRSTSTVSSPCTCPVWACQRAMDQLPCLETSTTF